MESLHQSASFRCAPQTKKICLVWATENERRVVNNRRCPFSKYSVVCKCGFLFHHHIHQIKYWLYYMPKAGQGVRYCICCMTSTLWLLGLRGWTVINGGIQPIPVRSIDTTSQLGDQFTKGLPQESFEKGRMALMGWWIVNFLSREGELLFEFNKVRIVAHKQVSFFCLYVCSNRNHMPKQVHELSEWIRVRALYRINSYMSLSSSLYLKPGVEGANFSPLNNITNRIEII
jgi:hypothetical protein